MNFKHNTGAMTLEYLILIVVACLSLLVLTLYIDSKYGISNFMTPTTVDQSHIR